MWKFRTICGLGLAAVVLTTGHFAKADTITVESLNFVANFGPGVNEWEYSANLSAFGEVETGDGFNITGISGLFAIGGSGGGWTFLGTPSSPSGAPDGVITATYSGPTISGAGPLVTVTFLDIFNNTVRPTPAIWGSQDHALDGTAETPVVGQDIASPGVAVPLPASAGIGFSLLGGFGSLAALRKRFSRRVRIA